MTLQEAIKARHSVRKYIDKPLPQDIVNILQAKVDECNNLGNLHIQLVTNEPKAFNGIRNIQRSEQLLCNGRQEDRRPL